MNMENHGGTPSGNPKKIGLFTGPGTRQWPRFSLSDIPSIKDIRSSAGMKTRIINMSRGGALLQTRKPLKPGTRIDFSFRLTEGTIQPIGWVLRSFVSSPRGMPQHYAAVSFDRPLRILDAMPDPMSDASRIDAFESTLSSLFQFDMSPSSHQPIHDEGSAMIACFLASSDCLDYDAAADEMLKLNNW